MITVVIRENGSIKGTLTAEQFMQYAKSNFGIGRRQFLQEYIRFFNSLNPNVQAETKI